MFCSNCGKEINDNAVICIHCGCLTSAANKVPANEDNTTTGIASPKATNALVYSILGLVLCWIPLVGLVFSIVAFGIINNALKLDEHSFENEDSFRSARILAILGLIGSIITLIIVVIIIIALNSY